MAKAITIHPGDPLNQTALRRRSAIFTSLHCSTRSTRRLRTPTGRSRKTVLLQAVEARRWALTYGFGFEAQTGTPQYNCGGIIASGATCNPDGKTGVSPRVLADITRNNLFGREQSASLQGTYGLLEQKIDLLFQNPHFEGNRNFGLKFSGGYANSLDVTTYVASKLEAGMRWTEHFSRLGPFFPRPTHLFTNSTSAASRWQASSLQVAPGEIAQLATAVRVAGPALTWIRDTRDSPLDAHRGTYTSFQEFLSGKFFGAQAEFNRLDVSNSSYYSFDKGRFVLARNTRYGQERAFGSAGSELIPLPERLYAGGATSLRGFSINAAGPRDPETGYPHRRRGRADQQHRAAPAAAHASLVRRHGQLRALPRHGQRLHQRLRRLGQRPARSPAGPRHLQEPCIATRPTATPPVRPSTSTGWQGACSFNYFSHAPGLGLRYHTPVGPIRLDFSYNLNPPIYPVNYNYSLINAGFEPHVGEAGHFNFFFSLGQTF